MIPFNLNLEPLRQEAVRRGRTVQQLSAPINRPNPAAIPFNPFASGAASAGMMINQGLGQPGAAEFITNAKAKQGEDNANAFVNRDVPPAISNEQALWTIGIGTLLRLLGASNEDVMGGANAFLGGQQAAWQREREKENQQFQLQQAKLEREAQFAQNIARIRGEEAQRREDRRLRGLGLITDATRAKSVPEAEAIFRAARELGAVPDAGTVRGTMQEIGEARKMARLEMEDQRLRQQSIQRDRLHDNFRTGQLASFERTMRARGANLDANNLRAINSAYDQLVKEGQKIGYEVPPLEFYLLPTMQQANLSERQQARAQRALQFEAAQDRRAAEFEWRKFDAQRNYDLRVQERRQRQANGLPTTDLMKAEQTAAQSLFNTEWKEFVDVQSKVAPAEGGFTRVQGGLIDPQVADFGSEYNIRKDRMFEMYYDFVREYGPNSKVAQDAYSTLKVKFRGQVDSPQQVARTINRPLGPVGAGQAPQGGGSGQPPVPFRNR